MNHAENKSIIQRTLEVWEEGEKEERKESAEVGFAIAELLREKGSPLQTGD